jgi:hypothetical protein
MDWKMNLELGRVRGQVLRVKKRLIRERKEIYRFGNA